MAEPIWTKKIYELVERLKEHAEEIQDAILLELLGYLEARLSGECEESDEEAS